ncbi:MAG: PIN domain-containing protein [Luteitalea sp.]|nr:PIN domain-containing protein [Luteitalea sp.]
MAERHPRGVLDTSVVIDLVDIPDEKLPVSATISAITLAELSQGVHLTHDPRERATRAERLQSMEAAHPSPLSFDADAARRYGRLVALTLAAGRSAKPRRIDLMIAATASVNGLPLFTRNSDDFEGLESALTVVLV